MICGGPADDRHRRRTGHDRSLGEGNRRGPDGEHYGDLLIGGSRRRLHGRRDDVGFDYLWNEQRAAESNIDWAAGTVTGEHSGHDTFTRLGAIIGSGFDDVLIDDVGDSYIQAGGGNGLGRDWRRLQLLVRRDRLRHPASAVVLDLFRGGDGDDVIETR